MNNELTPALLEKVAELEAMIKKEADKYKGMPVAISGGIDSSTLAALIKPEFVINVELPCGEKYDEGKYAKIVCEHIGTKLITVITNHDNFNKDMKIAVKAIGRPIPHFNIFALFAMYKKLNEMGVKELILGDGPDETMSGYTRNMIMYHIYSVYFQQGFEHYVPTIKKILRDEISVYADLVGKPIEEVRPLMDGLPTIKAMNKVDMELMRPDMDDMSNGIAKYFGIRNIRPYQDNTLIDHLMYELPDELKIQGSIGKIALRLIAAKYLPSEIAWRTKKVGGPVYPVNLMQEWMDKGEFDKTQYLAFQKKILGI